MSEVELRPVQRLDESWQPIEDKPLVFVPGRWQTKVFSYRDLRDDSSIEAWQEFEREDQGRVEEANEARAIARAVIIKVAPLADAEVVRQNERFSYVRSDFGMNILLQEGKITFLRFQVELSTAPRGLGDVQVVDGLPSSVIEDRYIVRGHVKIALDKALNFIPLMAGAPVPVDIALGPWDFKMGNVPKIKVLFSGDGSNDAEWVFKSAQIRSDVRVSLIARVPKEVGGMTASVLASYTFKAGFRESNWRTDAREVSVDW